MAVPIGEQSPIRVLAVSDPRNCGSEGPFGDGVSAKLTLRGFEIRFQSLTDSESKKHSTARLQEAMLAFEPDIVHLFSDENPVRRNTFSNRSPSSVVVQSLSSNSLRVSGFFTNLHVRFHRVFRNPVARFIVSSQWAKNLGVSRGIFEEDRCSIVPPAFDLNRFRSLRSRRGPLREKLGIDRGAFLVGVIRSNSPGSHDEDWIRLLDDPELVEAELSFLFRVDPSGADDLRRRVDSTRSSRRCHFLDSDEDSERFFAEIDFLLDPNPNPDFPWELLKGLAAGIPSVGPEVGAIPEFIRPGEWVSGTYFPGEPEGIEEHLKYTIDHRELMELLARESKRYVVESFGPEKIALTYETLYRTLLGKN